ncbi:MAG: hypothetical protein Kow0098_06350 [Ignavibacteriaceae bacterium]
MRNKTYITTFLSVFLVVTLLLRFFNFIQIDYKILVGLYIALPGISLFYAGFERKSQLSLFAGCVLFLSGLVLVFMTNQMIINPERIIYPSALFIPGFGFLMLFFLETRKKIYLLAAALLIISGLVVVYIEGNLSVGRMIKATASVLQNYWLIFVLVIAVIILSIKDRKKL